MTIKKLLLLSVMSALAMAQEDVQLFEYTHPTPEIQLNYIVSVSEQIMMKQRWDRNFDGTACPETSKLLCTKAGGCNPVDPPIDPPDICDLPDADQNPDCQTGGTCVDTGTCPIPICLVPLNLRVVEEGETLCLVDFCKDPVNANDRRCKPVDLCDLKFYKDNLDECNELPPEEDKCKLNPKLCVISCDLTGEYSPCTYEVCETYPFLPGCNSIDPEGPCEGTESVGAGHECCTGSGCDNHEHQCEWAFKIGGKSKQVSDPIFTDKKIEDAEGNIFLECLNEVEVVSKKDILFECFKEGVEMGDEWTRTTKDKILDVINLYKGDGEIETMDIGENSGSATISEEKREKLEF